MGFLGKRLLFVAPALLGLLACSSALSSSGSDEFGGFAGGGASSLSCTEDAGVLTPIGPQGCGPGEIVVYRKPLAGSGASGIASAAGTGKSSAQAMLTACTETKCAPGQVAVVNYEPAASGDPLPDGGGSDEAATTSGDGAAPVVDGGSDSSAARDGALPANGDASSPSADGSTPDGATPDAAPRATSDASGASTRSAGDAGAIGIPCGAVVTCVDAPPSCPAGQSPSYTPSGRWHCMPLCDTSDGGSVLITYGAQYGNTTVCAGPPPTNACPTAGQVWTWDYQDEQWVCASECDNGQYDQHTYDGQTVCVPC